MDVVRRGFMQFLKDGNDPREVMPEAVKASTIEQHAGLYYLVLRPRAGFPPVKVYRVDDDRSLKGLARWPRSIRDEAENATVLLSARMKKAVPA